MNFLKASFSTANSSKPFIDLEEVKTKILYEKSKFDNKGKLLMFWSDIERINESNYSPCVEKSSISDSSYYTWRLAIDSEEFDTEMFPEHSKWYSGISLPSTVVSSNSPFS